FLCRTTCLIRHVAVIRNGTIAASLCFAAQLAGLAASASGCLALASVPGWQPEAAAPPAVDRLWKPPDGAVATPADLPPIDRSLPERGDAHPHQPYDLAELIDLALERNPETRRAWAEAHASAAALGRAAAPYYPTIDTVAEWGPQRFENHTGPGVTTV